MTQSQKGGRAWLGLQVGALSAALVVGIGAAHSAPESPAAQPDPALRLYLSGNGLLNRGLYDLAAAEYRKFLASHADHEKAAIARYGLAVSLFRLNKLPEAASELAPLLNLADFPYAAEAWTMVGQCRLAGRDYGSAADAFQTVLQRHGEHELADDAAQGAVEALYLMDRFDHAADGAREFVARWPQSPLHERVLYFWALAEVGRKNDPAAIDRFEELIQRHPSGAFVESGTILLAQCYHRGNVLDRAVTSYRTVLEQGGRYVADALAGLGSIHFQRNELQDAGAALDRLIGEFGDGPDAVQARLQRGRVWFEQGEWDRAADGFRLLENSCAERCDEAMYWLAKCELRKGDATSAAARLADAVRRFPQSSLLAEMVYDRAVALSRAGDNDGAVGQWAEFCERFPTHALHRDALYALATTQHRLGRYDRSDALCEAFLSQYADDERVPETLFLSAENLFLSSQLPAAITKYSSFLGTFPNHTFAGRAKLRLGLAHYQLEQFAEARKVLSEVAQSAPRDSVFAPALLALGDVHFQNGEWEQAQLRLGEYFDLGLGIAARDDALLKIALSQERRDQHEPALASLDRLIAEFPDSPHRLQAQFERGQCMAALQRWDDAQTAFEMVLESSENSRFAAPAVRHLAAIAGRRERPQAAAAWYERLAEKAENDSSRADAMFQQFLALAAAEQFEAAATAIQQFIERFPHDIRHGEARARRVIALARMDRCDEVVAAASQLDETTLDALPPELRTAFLYERAWCLRALGRTDDAAQAYRRVLSEPSPGSYGFHAMLELAELECGAKRYEPAANLLRQLRTALDSRADEGSANLRENCLYRLGACELQLGRYAEAAECFDAFVTSHPGSSLIAFASFHGGDANLKAGRYERAVSHFTRIVKEFKDHEVLGPTLLRLGECLALMQRWATSEQTFAAYLDRFPQGEQAYQAQFGMGWARENQQRYTEAIAAYEQVVAAQQGPTAARAQFQIGQCYFAEERFEEAVRELLKVDILYAYPEWSAAALYEAGRCFERIGKTAEAQSQFQQIGQKYAQTQWAELAAKQLSDLSSRVAIPGR